MKSRSTTTPARDATTNNADSTRIPLSTLRFGRLKAVVWENDGKHGKLHNVSFSRTYMDENKQFHDSDSFGTDDLLLLAKLADQVHTLILTRRAELKNEE